MKHFKISFLFSFFLISVQLSKCYGQTLYLKEKDSGKSTKYAYINDKGEVIVPFGRYVFAYSDTIVHIGFVAKKAQGIMAIDPTGKELFGVFVYDNGPDYLEEGLFRILGKNGKMGYADSLGHILIAPQYDFAEPFKDGKARVCMGGKLIRTDGGEHSIWSGGQWGMIDKQGKIIVPIQ